MISVNNEHLTAAVHGAYVIMAYNFLILKILQE